jgi:hypothetical protein
MTCCKIVAYIGDKKSSAHGLAMEGMERQTYKLITPL